MLLLSLECRKNTGSKNPNVVKTKNGRIMVLSKCAMCDRTKIKIYQRAKS